MSGEELPALGELVARLTGEGSGDAGARPEAGRRVPAEHRDRPVAGACPAAPLFADAVAEDVRDLLVVSAADDTWAAEPREAERFTAALARGGAAALALPARPDGRDAPHQGVLREAARRAGLPVVRLPPGVSWLAAARAAGDLRSERAGARGELLVELLSAARRAGPGCAAPVLDWLAGAVRGTAEVLPPHTEPARGVTPRLPRQVVSVLRSHGGHRELPGEGRGAVRLYALGADASHPLLVVSSYGPFGERAEWAVAQALPLLDWSARLPQAEHRARAGVGVAVLQLLMGGFVPWARRTAQAMRLSPAVLTASAIRVHLLSCPSELRDAAADVCRDRLGERALVVRCPIDDGHVILVTAASGRPRDEEAERTLAHLIGGTPAYRLGTSRPLGLESTARAYEEASRALAVARNSPERMARCGDEADLVALLGPAARRWARLFLRPLGELGDRKRVEALSSVGLALAFGVGGAAELGGLHRNTVRAHLNRVAGLLGLDLRRLGERAVLAFALHVADRAADLPGPSGSAQDPDEGDIPLGRLLGSGAARDWADGFLAPLAQEPQRALRETLAAWVAHEARAEPAAAQLRVHYKTVLARLAAAERLLGRPLLDSHRRVLDPLASADGFSGAHDVALALHVTAACPGVVPERLLG